MHRDCSGILLSGGTIASSRPGVARGVPAGLDAGLVPACGLSGRRCLAGSRGGMGSFGGQGRRQTAQGVVLSPSSQGLRPVTDGDTGHAADTFRVGGDGAKVSKTERVCDFRRGWPPRAPSQGSRMERDRWPGSGLLVCSSCDSHRPAGPAAPPRRPGMVDPLVNPQRAKSQSSVGCAMQIG